MTINKIKKIIKIRTTQLPKNFDYIIEKFKVNTDLKRYIWGISYRTSITLPNDDEIDLDIHPLFKSKHISDKEKLNFITFFLENSIKSINKLNISDEILKLFLRNIKNSKKRPFDIKICFGWYIKSLTPKRYTLYVNYNSQKDMIDIFDNILPEKLIKELKKTNTLIDTIAIDIFQDNKKNYKIYYRENIKNYKEINSLQSKITSIYFMKSYPQNREKIYIHFSNSINPIFFLKYLLDKKSYNDIVKCFKIPSYAKVYFIGYTKNPIKKVSLYLR